MPGEWEGGSEELPWTCIEGPGLEGQSGHMEFEWVLVCFCTVWTKAKGEWRMGRKDNTDTWPRLEEGQGGPGELRDPKGMQSCHHLHNIWPPAHLRDGGIEAQRTSKFGEDQCVTGQDPVGSWCLHI